jgi:hypothetical protein
LNGDQTQPDLFVGGLGFGRKNSHKKAQKTQDSVPFVLFCGHSLSEIDTSFGLERTVSGFGAEDPKRNRALQTQV